MHKRLIEEGFNRRYVLLPMLLSIALVLMGYWIVEMRRSRALNLTEELRQRQDITRLLVEASYKAMEAESAQRGFLLTGEEQYLPPLETGITAPADCWPNCATATASRSRAAAGTGRRDHGSHVKTEEMRRSVALLKSGQPRDALALVKTDLGLYQAFAIIRGLEGLRAHERRILSEGLENWEKQVRLNTVINTCNMAFTVLILLVLGLLATRDIRRRNIFATQLATQIDSRTSELRDLSLHMSNVAETEKHALARELHDELGGLLVAMRMDISQIRKRLGPTTDAGHAGPLGAGGAGAVAGAGTQAPRHRGPAPHPARQHGPVHGVCAGSPPRPANRRSCS